MAEAPEQIEELSTEEQFVKDKVDDLLEKVGEGHGEPMQNELANRLEKTVNGFHADASEMIENMKAKSEERRSELKNLWEHRNEESAQEKSPEASNENDVEESTESSAWEKRLEAKSETVKKEPKKAAKAEKPQKEEPKKKKKFGFFKRKKKKE